MKKIYIAIILAIVICAGFYSVVFWYSHSGFASTINQTYKGNITNGLVGWWTFDDSATTTIANDKSGNNNNGTPYGGVWGAAGKIGQGLYFDGASSTVQVVDSASLDVTNLTLSAWAKRNELSRVDSVISKGSYGIKVGSDDRPYFEILNGTENFADTGALSTSTRVYSLAVYNGKLYAGTYISSEVFRYDGGTTWTSVGVLKDNNATVYALKVYNGNLYGSTSSVGGAEIYRYDGGTTWTSVGTVGATTFISALVVYNNKLYAQGNGYNNYRYDGGTTWTSVGSSGGGVTYSFAVYNGKLYAGAANTGKVFRYEDDGATWTDIGAALGSYVMSLTVYNGNLYAGALSTSTVYRYDGGVTWTRAGELGSSSGVRAMVAYNGKLYGAGIDATTPSSLYRYDGGTTWTSIGQFCPTCSSTRTLAVYDGKIYGGTWDNGNVYSMGSGEAIYSTTSTSSGFNHLAGTYDGGTMKLFVNGVLMASYTTSTTVAVNTLPLLIGSSAGSSGASIGEEDLNGIIDDARIYNRALSVDEMKRLYQMGAGSTINKTPVSYGFASNKSNLVGWWTFDAKDLTTTVATDRSGSNNNGTRYDVTMPMAGKLGQGLGFDGASSTVQVADSASLDLTNNFTLSAWAKRNELSRVDSVISKGSYALKVGADDRPYFEILNGTENFADVGRLGSSTDVKALVVYKGSIYGAADDGHVYRYDGGTTWTDAGQLGVSTAVFSLAVYNGQLYGGSFNSGKVYRYDGGTTWTDVGQLGASATTVFALTVYKGKLYGGSDPTVGRDVKGEIYRYDGGTTWTDVGTIGVTTYAYSLISYNGNLYAGTGGSGHIYRYAGGTTWTDIGGLSTYTYELPIVVYNGQMYAGGSNNVYRYDGGTTWTNVGAPAVVSEIATLAVYNGKLYGDNGLGNIYRYDGGTTWTDLGQLGTNTSIYSMAVYDGKLFAGTYDSGKAYTIGSGEALYGSASLSTGFNYLSGTYNGSIAKLYVNGSLTASYTTSTTVAVNTLPLLIGSSAGSSGAGIGEENFNGIIDDARVYNTALTEKQIFELSISGVNTINKAPDITSPLSINNGLVGWWTFNGKDTTASTVLDKSGYGRYGTRIGNTKSVPGPVGQAISFNGDETDYINLSSSLNLGTTFTCTGWVRFSVADTWLEVVGNGDSVDYCIFFELGGVTLGVSNGQVYWLYTLGINRWHHLAITRSGTSATLYVNGISQGTQTISGVGTASLTVSKLADIGQTNGHPTATDDIRLYNRVLSSQEVMQLYRMGK